MNGENDLIDRRRWPFTEKEITSTARHLESLGQPPEAPLTEAEKDTVTQLGKGLAEGRVGDLEVQSERSLEQLMKSDVLTHQQTFYPGYFITAEGQADRELLGLPDQAGEADVRAALLDVVTSTARIGAAVRKEMATRSEAWYRQQMATQMGRGPATDGEFQEPAELVVNYQPEALLGKIADYQAYRHFFHEVGRQLHDDSSRLAEAGRLYVELHLATVNAKLAALYPHILHVAQQLSQSGPSVQVEQWSEQLARVAPFVANLYQHQDAERRAELLDHSARRLDVFRSGVGSQTEQGDFIPLLDGILEQVLSPEPAQRPSRLLPPDLIERLDNTKWDAEQTKTFAQKVLDKWDLLSVHDTDWEQVNQRSGSAEDGKWQIVTTPHKKMLSANGSKRVVYIPSAMKRTLTQTSPSGPLLVLAHELTHVLQAESDEVLAKTLPLAVLGGRRSRLLHEAGGIYQEATLLHEYFGRQRDVNVSYVAALRAKLAGASKLEVARAYDHTRMQRLDRTEDTDGKAQKRRIASLGNALRLYRNFGHNAQPLDYVEQELVVKELSAQTSLDTDGVLIAGSSFNLRESAALHRFGLLPSSEALQHPAHEVMRLALDQFETA